MGIDVHASLVKTEPVARLRQSYSSREPAEANIMEEIETLFGNESTEFTVCLDEIEEAIERINDDTSDDVIQFVYKCKEALSNSKDCDCVLIGMSY